MAPATWELTGVPYTSMREPGGIAEAIAVLRAESLGERLAELGVADAGDLELEAPNGERGPSGLLNEAALARLVEATSERVVDAGRRGKKALLVGGDCPVLLGALAGLGEVGRPRGLAMIDGHEDAWPPERSPTGEASDSELGIALGVVGEPLPAPLDRLVPLLEGPGVALLGPRDAAEIAESGVDSLRGRVACFAEAEEIGTIGAEEVARAALAAIEADELWLHVDLDALSREAFSAVDYRQPGGLGWDELDRLAAAAASDRRCRGASVVIYNPDLDPDREAARLVVDFACRLVSP